MCLITILPPSVELSLAQVTDVMSKNPDGVGIMFSQDGHLYTGRTMMRNPRKVHRWLADNPSNVERVVHFRKATAGATNRANLHPFEIHGRFGLMHNGTLPYSLAPTWVNDPRSDTALFVEDMLAEVPADALINPAVWKLINAAVEENRVVMLDGASGELTWTADELWTVGADDIILSNTYSLDDEKLWGVKKSTYYSFHGYAQPVPRATYTPVQSSTSPPAPTTHTALMPAKQREVTTNHDVIFSTYCSTQGVDRVPCSGRAVDHRWYGLAQVAMNQAYVNDVRPRTHIAPSTMLISWIHAKLTDDEVKSLSPERCRLLVDTLLDFTKTGSIQDLIKHFKEPKCQTPTPSVHTSASR